MGRDTDAYASVSRGALKLKVSFPENKGAVF